MPIELYDDVIETDYGQFDLVWSPVGGYDGDNDVFFADQINGLVGAGSPHGVYLVLARRSGPSSMRIVLHGDEPALDDSWEDIVEVSTVVADDTEPSWATWAEDSWGSLAIPSGSYRVRVSARGRDEGAGNDVDGDEFAEQVVDFYLVDLWPAATAPDAILRTTSENAAYWHEARGNQRQP